MICRMRDEVDRIVEAWRRERPDLDVGPLHILSRVTRLARHLDRERRTAFERHELEPFEFDVLAALRRSGEPYQLTPGQLLTRTMVTSGTMTNRIDRLTERKLVRRLPDPGDRRGVLVRLTAKGQSKVDDAFADLVQAEHAIIDGLGSAEAEKLGDLLRILCLRYETDSPTPA